MGFKSLQRGKEIENLFLFILHEQLLNYCLSKDTGEERRAAVLPGAGLLMLSLRSMSYS